MEQIQFDLVGRKILTVTELTVEIKTQLEGRFGSVWVEGEVSNHSVPASGHHYFTLKDEGAQIRCIMFRHQAMYSKFLPADGRKILAHARVTVYGPRGEYQLAVDRVEPLGVGALEIAFQELKGRLAAEGLFDPQRKQPIPEIPRKVGVVTSLSGAAIQDVIKTVTSRSKFVDLLIAPVRVQGEGAAAEIAEAIRLLDGPRNPWGRLDVIIIGRGGGSLEDLWAFNEEVVARAIAGCRTPIISAVGHETDFSISDFVADMRAETPTAAAQRVSPRQADIVQRLDVMRSRAVSSISAMMQQAQERLVGLRRALPDPRREIEHREMRLDELAARMQMQLGAAMNVYSEKLAGMGTRLKRAPLTERIHRKGDIVGDSMRRLQNAMRMRIVKVETSLQANAARLAALNPMAVLDRGYAVARRADGAIIKNSDQVNIGEDITITLSKGSLAAEVKKKEP